jgi:hypothetical protein
MHAQNFSIRIDAFPGEEHALRVLGLMLGACIFAYVGFVSFSIMNVIAYREAVASAESLRTELGLLEQEYFELSKGIHEDRAERLGLVPVSDRTFVRMPGALGSAGSASEL